MNARPTLSLSTLAKISLNQFNFHTTISSSLQLYSTLFSRYTVQSCLMIITYICVCCQSFFFFFYVTWMNHDTNTYNFCWVKYTNKLGL